MSRRAILLANLGSPNSPSVPDVRRYLREFLGDPRVLDIPAPLRWLLLEGVILRTRPAKSAHAYGSIWGENGSPLIHTSGLVRAKLEAELAGEAPVYVAMRYGRPSIPAVMDLMIAEGIDDILLIPQYPHYAMSSWETVEVLAREVAARHPGVKLSCIAPFFEDPDYIEAMHAVMAPFLAEPHDHLLFSFHGIPVRHLRKAGCTDGTMPDVTCCCGEGAPTRCKCYRAQVYATARAVAARAGLTADDYSVSFQSRLAGEPWLQPFTDHVLAEMPRRGIKRLLVVCPSFVTDCLETLEEISVAGRQTFLDAGGTSFRQIPCLNDQSPYIRFLAARSRDWLEKRRLGGRQAAALQSVAL